MADIISGFSDSILCYILSFLPTKLVVATSVLSKRWKRLWHRFKYGQLGLLLSLHSFLLWRDMDQPFRRLRFRCCSIPNDYRFERCIKAAMSRIGRLEHLDLNLHGHVPSEVFSCKTLVVLKLANLVLKNISFVDFPLLKILHLNSVSFSEDQDLQQFLSGSPNVEDLKVKNFIANGAEKLIRFPRLARLVRANIDVHLVPLENVKNVQVLVTDWVICVKFVSPLLSILREKVEFLIFFTYCLLSEEDERAVLLYLQSVPTCISSHLKTCCFNIYRRSGVELLFAKYILQNAKFLQVMKFCFHGDTRKTFWMNPCIKRDLSSYISDTCTLSFE
ncbi:hypothetical protein PHAVU_004G015000 [Phaseolus vulgaris]|uniref:FBD domain-containing protein n=1 Tax=Phaseolus vulgaris TaxID=3885 RepID=V7C114_PHAVU|nr:hypothetical protein PHAVU_004G015000g [Phaseolus vulgaris]ESW23058.1 hypothetical protein PHAVU_004G015000g [Phaseolus vulgaris]